MAEILQVFRKNDNDFFSLESVFSSVEPYLSGAVTIEKYNVVSRAANLRSVLKNLFYLRKKKANVFHITGDIHYGVFAFPKAKTILTIHDCVFLKNPSATKRWILKKIWLEWPVKHCSIITTISEATRNEIIRNTNCAEKKIVVIPDPLNKQFTYVEKAFNKKNPLILQVGTWPNKNLERVAAAMNGLPCRLSIIGVLSEGQKKILTQNNIEYSNSSRLSDEELFQQYVNADIVLFASTFEGFGLPVIEAQATGRALITSNISPMKEVAGDGACFIDPFDIVSIREGIIRVMNDDELRSDIIRKGKENVKKYDPRQIAEQYLSLYKKMLNKN